MNIRYLSIVALSCGLLFSACGGQQQVQVDPNMNDNIVLKQGATNQNSSDAADTSNSSSQTILKNNSITAQNDMSNQNSTAGSQLEMPVAGEEIVVMETTKGTMKIRLFPKDAPNHVKNYQELIKKGYYDGLIFHRVIKDFMVQGGDPTGTGTGGESYLGKSKPIADETNTELKHLYGTVAMAKSGPDTAGSQFYIVNNKEGAPFLDSGYTAFGQVFDGLDVLNMLSTVETDKCSPYERRLGCDKPLKDISMVKVTLETQK